MTRTPHILIVEDDREIATLVSRFLRNNDFRIRAVANGREMDAALRDGRFDLIVLDLMLPGEDGLSLCRSLRATSATPVIMLTARGDPIDRIVGLEMGADDYMPKPFEPRELVARIRSVLRRSHALPPNMEPVVMKRAAFAGWVLDRDARALTAPDGRLVMLSGAEFDLIDALAEHSGRVLSREQLRTLAVGADADDRAIDLRVSRLRQRLGDDARAPTLIKTVRNLGYVLAAPVVWS